MMIRPVNNNKIGQVKRANAICLSVYVPVYLNGYAHIFFVRRQTIRKSHSLKEKEKKKVTIMMRKQ